MQIRQWKETRPIGNRLTLFLAVFGGLPAPGDQYRLHREQQRLDQANSASPRSSHPTSQAAVFLLFRHFVPRVTLVKIIEYYILVVSPFKESHWLLHGKTLSTLVGTLPGSGVERNSGFTIRNNSQRNLLTVRGFIAATVASTLAIG